MSETATQAEIALKTSFDLMKDAGAQSLRRGAWEAFANAGLPNKRVESWHYTDLRAALRAVAPLAGAAGAVPAPERRQASCRLVVLDGAFRPDLSDLAALPAGVGAQSLREALASGEADILAALAGDADDAMIALNAALMQDGVVLRIAPGTVVEQPLEILNAVSSAGAAHSVYARSLVMAGAGASATLIETLESLETSDAQENHALLLCLERGARLEHVCSIARQAEGAVRVLSLLATLGEKAALNSFCLIEGGGLIRRQVFATLAGEGADAAFCGANLLRGRDHADTTLLVRHQSPGGKSREYFRYIIDESATGVFQGKVSVAQPAQKTDGAMQSKAILLSDGATMNSKPELEIFADDVVCGHGATCGRLDADQLFYLQARGLPQSEAEALLIQGFANEALKLVAGEQIRETLEERISAWLARRDTK
ncbi:Fe-S cluster assembly protein SufD [Methylocystis heyeri]|uniref:Fe-S cluster assembly protein SufD n=1 Tax=Methylocystis heyeri TaxID=391905 RepID=A0A6B8K907_9HYPH|nr:Fe-S cluster assembly protein SufD [Methylocystis heyeri]QGM44546.1 Fe-S cluster assembly protein SufD [Methylocystis heyeri]